MTVTEISLIGSLKAWFVTERSGAGSCRTFRGQYPILNISFIGIHTLWLKVTRG
jgi:hypothetical protein